MLAPGASVARLPVMSVNVAPASMVWNTDVPFVTYASVHSSGLRTMSWATPFVQPGRAVGAPRPAERSRS